MATMVLKRHLSKIEYDIVILSYRSKIASTPFIAFARAEAMTCIPRPANKCVERVVAIF